MPYHLYGDDFECGEIRQHQIFWPCQNQVKFWTLILKCKTFMFCKMQFKNQPQKQYLVFSKFWTKRLNPFSIVFGVCCCLAAVWIIRRGSGSLLPNRTKHFKWTCNSISKTLVSSKDMDRQFLIHSRVNLRLGSQMNRL